MSNNCHNGDEFIQGSSLYQEYLAEREEIMKHKWIESEKAGRDIGFERALLDWIRNYRDGWRRSRREQLSGKNYR
jgi:hypothetical protein